MFKPFLPILICLVLMSGINPIFSQTNEDLYFVFLNSNPDKPQISEQQQNELQTAHMDNIKKLNSEGKLLAAGPLVGGGGIFILHAPNLEEAWSFVNTDPAVAANRFNIEIFPFSINNNNLCGAKEPYEMVTYQMIRLTANEEYSSDIFPMKKENRIFMANLNNSEEFVVVAGTFDDLNSGILILDLSTPEEAEKIILQNPAVVTGQLDYEIKQLWIAKGTFCKK